MAVQGRTAEAVAPGFSFLGSSIRYIMALVKKKNGARRHGVYEREEVSWHGVHGEGQVRGRVETEEASESRLCIMGTVLRTCETDTGREGETVRGNQGRVLCGGIDRRCVSLHAYVT